MVHTVSRQFRPLSELNLIDNFLFHEMMADKENGEEFCRILLKTILNKEVRHVKITPQKNILGPDTNNHGIRMDAYLEEVADCDAIDADIAPDIYDIEPNQTYEIDTLPKRMRYYHALIDAGLLRIGETYDKLPNVVVIFILPYDPFGQDRCVYTIQNMITEDPSIDYNDGALKMILYTKGKAGKPRKELLEMLKYFEKSTTDNVTNPDIECVHHMVDRIKERKELNLEYMKSWEWDDYNKKLGREEGKKEERKNSIHILISTCKKLSCDDTLILDELMSNFSLSCEEAIAYLEEYSK